MRKLFQQIIAIALCIAMVSALLPAQQLGLEMAVAKAESAPAVTPDGYADLLDQAAARLEGGERSDGDWRYVLIEEKNVAVVTGYDGTAAEELTVPELLGGADTAGIAAGALSGLKGVKRIGVPMNVVAIGKGALPAGAAVMSNNGVYAAKWARKNGHAFTSTSDYDFVADVVDLTGARPENFNRVSAEEIWLRDLEASQISVGTKFFLLDPDNLYQISYYQATELTAMAGGFVAVHCTTPDVNSVLYYYEATDEKMMVDYSTVRLAEGVEIDPETEKAISGKISGEFGLKFKPKVDLGGGWELKGSISKTFGWSGSYEVGLFADNAVKIEQTEKLQGSVELGYSYDHYEDEHKDLGDAVKAANKVFTSLRKEGLKEGEASIDLPMGSAVVFSVAGILNIAVKVTATFEASGQISISFSNTSTTTYTFKSNSLDTSTKKGVNSFEGSVEGNLKVGVTASVELYIMVLKAFTASLFVGMQAEIKWDFSQLMNKIGNWVMTNMVDAVVFDEAFNINMLDCVNIEIFVVAEIGYSLGVGKFVELASAKVTLMKKEICKMHWHVLPVDFTMEATEDDRYAYKLDGVRTVLERIHGADDCPYDVKTATFHMDFGSGDRIIRRYPNLPIGTKVEEPQIDAVKDYGVKLNGWYTDASFKSDSLVTEWPHTITADVNFYANVSNLRKVILVGADGATLSMDAAITDGDDEWTYKERNGLLAMGEKLTLPDTDSAGREIRAWVQVESDTTLSPIGDEIEPGKTFSYEGYSADAIYLCALTENDIMARFYTGVSDNYQTVYATRGTALTVPECEDSIPCRRFAGWEASDGAIHQPGDGIATDMSTPAVLVYGAVWEYTGEVSAEHLNDISLGYKPSTGSPVTGADLFYWRNVDGGVEVTGFNTESGWTPVDVSVPAYIDGLPVISIGSYAFDKVTTLRSIIFPSTVLSIGSQALQGCTALEFIDLAETQITSIPAYFADGCTALKGVLLPAGRVKSVATFAFNNCQSLTRANIDYNVGSYAFQNCYNLSTVNIGAGCTAIDYGAFYYCTALKDIVIPDSVTSIGGKIFYGCSALQSIEIQSGVTKIGDAIFDIGQYNSLKKVVLGFGVKEIAAYALDNDGNGFPHLKELSLPASLKTIGTNAFRGTGIELLNIGFSYQMSASSAFSGMNSLKELNVTSGPIPNSAFNGLTALETLNIGEGVTSIGMTAFSNCTSLKEVNMAEGLTSIGYGAFSSCYSLGSVSIPDSVVSLGGNIFDNCTGLTELSVGRTVNKLADNHGAFSIGTSYLTTLTLREGVVKIPQGLFNNGGYGHTSLETINLPSTLQSIGNEAFKKAGVKKLVLNGAVELNGYAFEECTRLEELEVNGGSVGSYAFRRNTGLKKVTVNASVIGSYAFDGCTSLTDLIIGEGVRTIGSSAFANCTALTNVEIRGGVRTIGDYAFQNCWSLGSIAFPDSVTDYGLYMLQNCTGLTELTIGGGQSTINMNEFVIGQNSSLRSIVIREGVTEIGANAFQNSNYGFTKLVSVDFPVSLQSVGNRAFVQSALESAVFKSAVSLGEYSFCYMDNLKTVYMPAGIVGYNAFYCSSGLTDVYLGDNVTFIGGYAFYGCSSLRSIRLGNGLTTIGSEAFYGCYSLKSLTIPDSVTLMYNDAMEGCTGLEYLSIGTVLDSMSSILYIGEGSKLRTLVIREGVTKIAYQMFGNNGYSFENLETVSLPTTLTSIGSYAFYNSGVRRVIIKGDVYLDHNAFGSCSRLEEVSIAGGGIGDYCFSGCTSLKKAEILSGTIGESAFKGCTSLETLTLGDSVTSIDRYALENCRSLKELYIPEGVTSLGNGIIKGCTALETLVLDCHWSSNETSGDSPFRVGAASALKTLIISENVTKLPSYAFQNASYTTSGAYYGYDKLESVVIPASVTYIGNYVFGSSGAGPRVLTIKGNPSIATGAFAGLTSLEEVYIEGGSLGESVFSYCSNLRKVVLGEGISQMDMYTFSGCWSLESLYIPDNASAWPRNFLTGCTGLKSLSSKITDSRFYTIGQNLSLHTIEIRGSVTGLNNDVFDNRDNQGNIKGMPSVETLILPDSLNSLNYTVLRDLPNLKHLYLGDGASIADTAPGNRDLTIYTSVFNQSVSDYAQKYGVKYVYDTADYPTFNLNLMKSGASARTVLESRGLRCGEQIVLEDPQIGEGDAFYGWFIDPECTVRWQRDTMPAEDVTLYARIEPLVNVRFAVSVGGSADANLPEGWNLYASYRAEDGAAFTLPEEPAIDGWNFRGWYLDASFLRSCKLTKVPASDIIIYAKLERLPVGGEYKAVSGGLQLTKYTLMEDENPAVYIPARVGGVPVVSIAHGAFEGSGVKSLVIPSTVTEIQPGALNCATMKTVSVNAANTAYVADSGVVFNADRTELVYYPNKKADTGYTVPASVVKIGGWAFADNKILTRVYFGGSNVTEIGEGAFSGMTNLTRIDLPDSVTTLRLNAFANCASLEYFYAYGLETIETGTGMDTLPYGTGMWVYGPVGEGVLRDYFSYTDSDGKLCTSQYNLYKLRLYLNSWEEMYIEAGQLLPELLADVKLDNGTVVNEWRVGSASGEPVDLATYTMPAAETALYAAYTTLFDGAYGTVTDASGTSVSGFVFTGWNGTGGKVVIPANYSNYASCGIGEGFLANSNAFTEITIPAAIVSIADGALGGFTGAIVCDPDSYAAQWADEHGVEWEPILYTLSFVTKGEDVSSMQAAKGTLIYLPEAERAGFDFDGWHVNESCATDVTLDEDGLYAMPGADTTLYAGWTGTEEVVPFTWTSSNKQVTVTGYTGTETNVTIPDTINSWPVTAVAASAFAGTDVVQVDLGQVKTVGSGAFEGCEALRTVAMNAVTEIGSYAFANCPLLRAPELPDTLVSIGNSAFEGCSAIGSIVIPDSVTTIGKDAFASCGVLRTVSVGAGVKSMNAEMFSGCDLLREITVSDANASYKSVNGALYTKDGGTLVLYPAANTATAFAIEEGARIIGDRAFAGAKNLTDVTFPDSLTEIGEAAFEGSAIERIELNHVETIGDSAFFGCSALETADLGDSIIEIGSMAFAGCGSLTDVIIPVTAQMDEDTAVFSRSAILVIIGKTGSSAQLYAKANGIAFSDPDAVNVERVLISAETLTMNRGESTSLTATVQPAEAVSGIEWRSDDSGVVMVDENGRLRAVGGGSAVITAVADNGVSASCDVTVVAAVEKIIPDIVKPIPVGANLTVGVSLEPLTPTDTTLTWTSADDTIATVSADGTITAVAAGDTVVTVTAVGGASAQIPVTVYTPVETLTIEAETNVMLAVKGMNTLQLSAVITPDDATYADCTWSSSHTGIATVDENGLVSAWWNGTVTITATARDPGGISATFDITVETADLAEVASVEITEARLTADGYVLNFTAVAGEETLDSGDYTASVPEITGPGEYVLTLTGAGYFTGTLEVPFTLEKFTPEITMDDRGFVWLDELNPVVSVVPETEYTLEYVLIGEDGSRTSVGSAPTVSGLYEIIAGIAETGYHTAAEACATMWIQTDGGVEIYDSIALTPGQQGSIPVTAKSEHAQQSGYAYATSDPGVFTVDENGRITAVGTGSAVLTVTGLDDSRFTGSCEITVKEMQAMILPAALKEIEAEAFAGTPAVQQMVVGGNVSLIGSRAFADMTALEQVVFGSGSPAIDADAFDGSDPLIVCKAGSAAAAFAAEHGLKLFAD